MTVAANTTPPVDSNVRVCSVPGGGGSAASADVMGGWANERGGRGDEGEVGEGGGRGERPEGREGEARESWCGPRRTRTSRVARAPRRRTICRSSRSTPQPWGRGSGVRPGFSRRKVPSRRRRPTGHRIGIDPCLADARSHSTSVSADQPLGFDPRADATHGRGESRPAREKCPSRVRATPIRPVERRNRRATRRAGKCGRGELHIQLVLHPGTPATLLTHELTDDQTTSRHDYERC